jgi:hypothetical protein
MQIKKIFGAILATAVAGTMAVAVAAETYNAYIFAQTAAYSFRNKWDDATYGKDSGYFDKFIVWGGNDPETYPEYEDKFDYDVTGYLLDATITDAVVDGDGTYKVGLSGIDWTLEAATGFNLIGVSTDIPYSEATTITDAKLIIDGEVVAEQAEGYLDPDATKAGYMGLLFANIWNTELESYTGKYPTASLEIEFTITGIGAEAPETDAPATDAPETDAPATDAPVAGDSTGKPNAGTGVEGLALVAGIAVLATGAVVVSKKRK